MRFLALLLTLVLCASLAYAAPTEGTVYEYRVSYTFVNETGQEVEVPLDSDVVRLILAPDIDGWQKLLGYKVIVNGVDKTSDFESTNDDEGNALLISRKRLELGPSANATIELVQHVLVYPPWLRQQRKLPSEVSTGNVPGELTYTGGFWASEKLDDVASSLWGLAGGDPRRYVLEVIKWVALNIKYEFSGEGGVASPDVVVSKKRGACGERAVIVTALLRRRGIGSYLLLSYYYVDKGEPLVLREDSVELRYVNAFPHIFSMCVAGHTEFPVDTALPLTKPEDPLSAVNRAMVNRSDRVVVVAKFVGSGPESNLNNLLAVIPPSRGVRVKLVVSLKVVRKPQVLSPLLLPLALLLLALTAYTLASKNLGAH